MLNPLPACSRRHPIYFFGVLSLCLSPGGWSIIGLSHNVNVDGGRQSKEGDLGAASCVLYGQSWMQDMLRGPVVTATVIPRRNVETATKPTAQRICSVSSCLCSPHVLHWPWKSQYLLMDTACAGKGNPQHIPCTPPWQTQPS